METSTGNAGDNNGGSTDKEITAEQNAPVAKKRTRKPKGRTSETNDIESSSHNATGKNGNTEASTGPEYSRAKKPQPAVRKKKPIAQKPSSSQAEETPGPSGLQKPIKNTSTQSKGQNRPNQKKNAQFAWSTPPPLLKFIKMSPEHLGRLEQEMKNEARVEILEKRLLVTALNPNEDDTWKKRAQDQLKDFLCHYSAQTIQRVTFFKSACETPSVCVSVLQKDKSGSTISVAGLAKEVEKKIFEIKEYDKKQTMKRNIHQKKNIHQQRNIQEQFGINPLHHARITDELTREIYKVTNVEVNHTRSDFLILFGEKIKIEQAKKMIVEECCSVTTKNIGCQEWLFQRMDRAIAEAVYHFPEISINYQGYQIQIKGHHSEVHKVSTEFCNVLSHLRKTFTMVKLPMEKRHHGCVIGKGGQVVKDLQRRHQVNIQIPPENSDSMNIIIDGLKRNVEAAKIEIMNLVKNRADNSVTVKMQIYRPHLPRITDDFKQEVFKTANVTVYHDGSGSLILYGDKRKVEEARAMIQDELKSNIIKNVTVADWLTKHLGKAIAQARLSWPEVEIKFAEDEYVLSGHPSEVAFFQENIEEKIAEVCKNLTCEEVPVRKEFHKCIIGKGGRNIKELRTKYQVEITIPPDLSYIEEVKIEGEKDQVEAAKRDITNLIKNLENSTKKALSVPDWLLKYVIGKKGYNLRIFESHYPQVRIDVLSEQIVMCGPMDEVNQVSESLEEKIKELQSKLKLTSIPLKNNHITGIVGSRGEKIREMRRKFKIDVHFTPHPPLLYIEGENEKVDDAYAYVLKTKQKLENFRTLAIRINSSFFGRLIGKGGANIKDMRSRYSGVEEIRLPDKDSTEDRIFLSGDRAAVDMLYLELNQIYCAENLGYTDEPIRRRSHRSTPSKKRNNPSSMYGSFSSLASSVKSPTPSEVDSSSTYDPDDYNYDWSQCDNDEDVMTQPAFTMPEIKVSVSFKYSPSSNYILKYVKDYAEHSSKLDQDLQVLGSVTTTEEEVIVNGEILESYSVEEWKSECKEKLDSFFEDFSFEEFDVPPHMRMIRTNEKTTQVHTEWNLEKTSVSIYGIEWAVNTKSGLLMQLLEKSKDADSEVLTSETVEELSRSSDSSESEYVEASPRVEQEFSNLFDNITLIESGNDDKEVSDDTVPQIQTVNLQEKKFLVLFKWQDTRKCVVKFVENSPLYLTSLTKKLKHLGNVTIRDEEVIVTGKILKSSLAEEWKTECKSEIEDFFKKFASEQFQVPIFWTLGRQDVRGTHFNATWNSEKNCLILSGIKDTVNTTADLLKTALNKMRMDGCNMHSDAIEVLLKSCDTEMSSATADSSHAIGRSKNLDQYPIFGKSKETEIAIDALEAGDLLNRSESGKSKKSFTLPAPAVNWIMASAGRAKELSNVAVGTCDDGVIIEGEKSMVLQAETFIKTIIADEVEIKKYGAHEFLTENSLQMEFIAIKSNCSILVEQIQGSSNEDDNFMCIPLEDEKNPKSSLYGNLSVNIEEGDITEDSADLIVNTTNKAFSLSGPLSTAIISKGGSVISRSCSNQFDSTMRLTDSGCLPCGHILHVAIPDKHESMDVLITLILEKAENIKARSITLPTIGAGGGGWKSQDVVTGMHNGIMNFIKSNPNPEYLRNVKIVIFPKMPEGDKEPFHSKFSPQTTFSSKPSTPGIFAKFISFFSGTKPANSSSSNDDTTSDDQNQPSTSSTDSANNNDTNIDSHLATKHKTTSGESAKVMFSSTDLRNIQKAKDEVDKFVALHLKDFILDSDAIVQLKKNQIDDIQEIALDKKVRIVIDQRKDKHSIVIQGRVEYATAANAEVQKIIETIPKGLPSSWKPMASNKVLRVRLFSHSEEYRKVFAAFNSASGTNRFVVKSIERIQNPVLYQHYQLKKEEISARVKNRTVEQQLFHGTSSDTVDAICNHGFNRSYAGKNATAYGKGVYFSIHSYYSDSYTQGSFGMSRERQMFLANVLTGDYCCGTSSMVEPPRNSSTNENYDSVVDSLIKPSIFVVFKDASVYPSYVIKYE